VPGGAYAEFVTARDNPARLNGSELLKVFADSLKKIHEDAGAPSVRVLDRISRNIGKRYSHSTFSEKIRGNSAPDWRFVETFVRVCAIYAGRDERQVDLGGLKRDHGILLQQLAALRNEGREQSRGVAAARAELAKIPADADFIKKRSSYLEALRGRYRDLAHTDILAQGSGMPLPLMPLRETFVPQSLRAQSSETELPREVRRRLAAQGRLNGQDAPEDVDREQLNRELRAYADSPRLSVLDVICEPVNRQILVLGAPGAGKSTLAAYLILALADLAAPDAPSADGHPLAGLAGYLPLLLELRTYEPHAQRIPGADAASDGEAAPGEVLAILEEIGHPHLPGHPGLSRQVLEPYLADGGKALIIFDGLDEVFDKKQREHVKWGIFNFAERYKGVRVLVTSRSTGYEQEIRWFAGHDFRSFMLQDLDKEQQIPEFARRFYHSAYPDSPAKAAALADRLNAAVSGAPALEELAGNPMLLTTLALALLGHGVPLPHKRGAVLKHLIDVLVDLWDADKPAADHRPPVRGLSELEPLDADAKRALLGLVARRIQRGGPGAGGLRGNFLSGRELRKVFIEYRLPTPEQLSPSPGRERGPEQGHPPEQVQRAKNFANALVDQLRKRNYILAEFGEDTFGFVHRALLDYLTAEDVTTQFHGREIEPPYIDDLFRTHSTAPEWQDVLLLLTGMLPQSSAERAMVIILTCNPLWCLGSDPLPRHVLLAIRCLGEVSQYLHKMPALSRAVVDALTALLETVSGPADYPLADELAQALERDVLPVLARLGPDWAGRRNYETWYLARGQFLGGDAPGFAAIAAARIYVALIGRDDQARKRLLALAGSADSVLLRGAALEALAGSWCNEPEMAELITTAAVDDKLDWYVRREAVRALAAGRPGDQATARLLRGCVEGDQAPEVRGAALRWLAAAWRTAETTPILLRTVGLNHAELPEVRAVAVAELAAGWHDEQTRAWLLDRADATSEDARVRAAAAEALAAGWRDQRTRHWLRGHTEGADERQPRVRLAAVHGLAAGWPDEPDTVALLMAKAIVGGDDDPAVRQAAVEALAAGRCEDQKVARWVRDRIEAEPDSGVRCVMAQALAAYWRDEATVARLRMLAEDRDWCVRAIAIRAVADVQADQRQADSGLPGWLRERAARDKNVTPYVRQVALSAAAAGWPDDRKTAPWLRERAADAKEDLDVRGAALQALAARWPDEETLALLRTIGEGDARTVALRQVAIRLVATIWRDQPRTQPWLSERAADDSLAVRRTALQLLAADTEWHDDPVTVALLRTTSVDGKSPEMRQAALRVLAAGWHDDATISSWVRDVRSHHQTG
jgi:HEAT repeats